MIETAEIRSQPNFSLPRHIVTAAGSSPDMYRLEMSVVVGNPFMMGRGCGKVAVSCITLRPSRRIPTAFTVRIGLCMWETQSRYSDRWLSFCEEPVVATIMSVTAMQTNVRLRSQKAKLSMVWPVAFRNLCCLIIARRYSQLKRLLAGIGRLESIHQHHRFSHGNRPRLVHSLWLFASAVTNCCQSHSAAFDGLAAMLQAFPSDSQDPLFC
jgi:hypothetical protein